MEDFRIVQEHTVENLTLLCETHHNDKTHHRLPLSIVRKANENPHNAQKEHTSRHRLFFNGDVITFTVGGNTFRSRFMASDTFAAIRINGIDILKFRKEDDALLVGLCIKDRNQNDNITVEDGELSVSTGLNDATFIDSRVTLTSDALDKPIWLNYFENGVNINSASLYARQGTVDVRPHEIVLNPGNLRYSGIFVSEDSSAEAGFVVP